MHAVYVAHRSQCKRGHLCTTWRIKPNPDGRTASEQACRLVFPLAARKIPPHPVRSQDTRPDLQPRLPASPALSRLRSPTHLPALPAGYGSLVHLYVVVAPFSGSPSVHTHSLRHLAFVYTHAIPQCSSWSMLHAASPAVSPPSHHHIMFPRKVSALSQKKTTQFSHDFLSPPNSTRATSLCLQRPRSPRPHHHVLDLHIIHISSRVS